MSVLALETGDRESVRPSMEGSSILPCGTTVPECSCAIPRVEERTIHIVFAEVLFYPQTSTIVKFWFSCRLGQKVGRASRPRCRYS